MHLQHCDVFWRDYIGFVNHCKLIENGLQRRKLMRKWDVATRLKKCNETAFSVFCNLHFCNTNNAMEQIIHKNVNNKRKTMPLQHFVIFSEFDQACLTILHHVNWFVNGFENELYFCLHTFCWFNSIKEKGNIFILMILKPGVNPIKLKILNFNSKTQTNHFWRRRLHL